MADCTHQQLRTEQERAILEQSLMIVTPKRLLLQI
ncbi:hypothetical protein T11_5796 [Trichinella zimbabwensis]|uniref:Uncharacterized protein n=1 Tax=Trichinella zimbabwensis TaxID=268475 RepID=A0A0V1DUN3_9BILA|nr:hypothetical protein T11_5796 [Trichinella zimbabwensis]